MLRLGDDLVLDIEEFQYTGRHTFITAATGNGKTCAGFVLIEEDLAAGRHVVVIDPEGHYGAYGTVAAGPDALEAYLSNGVGEALVYQTDDPGLYVDVAQELFRLADEAAKGGGPLRVTFHVDEAPLFTPNERFARSEASPTALSSELAQRGRSRGIWTTWLAQRPPWIHPNVRNSCSLYIVGRLVTPGDWRAVAPMLKDWGVRAEDLTILRPGQFYVATATELDLITFRPPAKGRYRPLIYEPRLAENDSSGSADLLAWYEEVAALPDEVIYTLVGEDDLLSVLCALADVDADVEAEARLLLKNVLRDRQRPKPNRK